MDSDLAKKLARREAINEGEDVPAAPRVILNPYTEFPEFSRKQIKEYEKLFKLYDIDGDNFLDLQEMKLMMEKLQAPQTHLGLKEMIHEVDEDKDDQISFREFLLIFRKAAAGELVADGLNALAQLTEIDVDKEGVKGAKNFFEAKVEQQTRSNKFEEEIRAEQEEKKRELEEAKLRKQAFKEKQAAFGSM